MQPAPREPSTLATAGQIVPPAPAAPRAEVPTLPPADEIAGTNPGTPAPVTPSAARSEASLTVPGYEILGVLGKGGMGVVYKARQLGLNRIVALKMILHAEHAGPAERARFKAEAEAVARLQHPHIVQVFEVGEHNGLPYFSLEFCGGGSLADKLDGTPLPPAEAAQRVEALARAMQVAHQAGIVHRDLKPANVLLAEDGTAKVTDFGLAKRLDVPGHTQTGAIMGTPSYMAPEQAGYKPDAPARGISPAADVYALGAILYECLTGRPPFRAATVMETLMQVVADEPVPVRQLQPKTPRDLETICLTCLRKEPARRYASAQELGEDLGRFLRGEPVRARPVGRLERGWRWCKRNPVVAGLLAAVLVVLVGGAAVSTWFGLQAQARARDAQAAEILAQQNANREREAREEVERSGKQVREALVRVSAKERDERLAKEEERAARKVADDRLYVSRLRLAQIYWQEGNVAAAREKLDETWDHRDSWEHRYLYTLMNHHGQQTYLGHTNSVRSVCFSPDGRHLASGSVDGTVKVWNRQTAQEILTLKGHTGQVQAVAFSPDGRHLASASLDQTVKVWNAVAGNELLTLKGHTSYVQSVCFSPDSKSLASGSRDNTVRLWDAATGRHTLTLKGHTTGVCGVCFSPNGKLLASRSGGWNQYGEVKLWDMFTGQVQLTLPHKSSVTGMCFNHDGTHIASASQDGTVRVWSTATGRQIFTLNLGIYIRCMCSSPDGKRLALARGDQTVKVRDVATGQEILTLRGHLYVNSVCFSPDGKRLVLGCGSEVSGRPGELKVCDAATGQEVLTLKGHTDGVSSVCFSPDGKCLASGSGDKTVKIWEAASGLNDSVGGRWWAGSDYRWHAEQAQQSWQARNWFAAAFHLGRLVPSRPWDADLHVRRAYALAHLGQPQAATQHYVQAIFLNPRVQFWPLDPQAATRGHAAAQAGDWPRAIEEFRLATYQPGAQPDTWEGLLLALRASRQDAVCRQTGHAMLDHFADRRDISTIWRLLFHSRVALCSEADAQHLVQWGTQLVAKQRNASTLDLLGASLYRANRFEEAVKALQESIKLHGKGGYADTWLFLAMTQQRLGHADAARQEFARFEKWFRAQRFNWQDRLRWQLLLNEANALVNPPLRMPRIPDDD